MDVYLDRRLDAEYFGNRVYESPPFEQFYFHRPIYAKHMFTHYRIYDKLNLQSMNETNIDSFPESAYTQIVKSILAESSIF